MSKDYIRINEIKKLLHNYNYEYYVNSNSLVSDYEFDLLLRELQFLEKKYPRGIAYRQFLLAILQIYSFQELEKYQDVQRLAKLIIYQLINCLEQL